MLALAACQPIQPPAQPDAARTTSPEVAPFLGNLGDHTHPITTSSALVQQYFDEGLILTFGFNHGEAIRSFQDALKLDPECAMCYWGIAYALGPNSNAPMDPAAVPQAWEVLQQALALAPKASLAEQAYIEALAGRYSDDPDADRAALDLAYADAMRELAQRYPDDLDAFSLYAEALMDLTPWNYWTKDGQPTEYTGEIVSTLETVLERNPDHPAANHFYIHLAGELAAAAGDFDKAVGELEAAVALQEGLPYIEPPAWYFPIRQMLGATLLEAGRVEEAVYRQDPQDYPDTAGRSLG